MAVYQKLLLAAGGGIISRNQQAKQSGTANILIGLGGTGVSCLRAVKGAVYERLLPDNPDADLPEYSHIKFMAVDSDDNDLGDPAKEVNAILETEFFNISSNNVEAAIKNEQVMAAKPEMSWLRNADISVPAMAAGAGGNRQIGRYLMMDNSFKFIGDLVNLINQAKAGLGATSVGIHIFAGISGGTGSGTFLDVCYMAQKALALVGATGNDKIFGYFFLPDVNLNKVTDPATRAYIPRNGYAALKELDYCMNLEKNGGAFVQQYQNGQTIEWRRQPVDLCHLISATNTAGAVEPNAYSYAMNVVSDYVMEFLAQSDGFTIESHLSNVAAKVATVQKDHGACNQYFVLGAASAQVPLKEINTYLASALFGRFSVIGGRLPGKADVQNLCAAVGLNYENLYRVIKNAAGGDFTPSGVTHKEVAQMGNKAIEMHYEKERDDMMGKIETKTKGLCDPNNAESMIRKVRAWLDTAAANANFGPHFAYNILNAAQQENLMNVIDGLIRQNNERMTYENNQSDRLWNEYHKTNAAQKAKPNKKNVVDYENALLQLDMHEIELDVFKQVGRILTTLKEQVTAAGAGFYAILSRVVANLTETFAQNKAVLDAAQPVAALANPYVMPLVTMQQIRPTLAAHVEKMDLNGMLGQFMGFLLANSASWINGDESKISKLVTYFFVENAFKDFADRNIMSYMIQKYETDNVAILQQNIYNDYMKPLMQKAEPLFWNNAAYHNTATAGKMGYISVPRIAAAIDSAGDQLIKSAGTAGLSKRQTELSDRIYIMRSYCGLPMYAYHALLNYEHDYHTGAQVAGRHYYEGKPQPQMGNPVWDWRTLPSIIPQSLTTKMMPEQVQNDVMNGRNLFMTAVKNGFIRPQAQGSDTMLLCKPSDQYLAALGQLIDKARKCIELGDAANGGMVKVELQKLIANPQVAPTEFTITCDASGVTDPKIKQNMICDYFVSSPMFRQTIANAVNVMMQAGAILGQLDELAAQGDIQQNFFDALLTGMFTMAGPSVFYTVNNMGMTEKIDLSLPTMKYGGLPLYQAYLTYQTMDKELLQAIKAEADNRKNTMAPQMMNALRAFKNGLNPQYMQFMQSNAKKHPAEYDVIIQYFKDLMTTIQTTAQMYGIM